MQAYVQINQIFADKTLEAIEQLKKDNNKALPLVWIHDYHLTLAASITRKVFFFLYGLNVVSMRTVLIRCLITDFLGSFRAGNKA